MSCFWRDDHPVLEALRQRRDAGNKDDGFKIGLAVEGGGMRAVISAAMLTALEDLGMAQVFDVVYGSSAGALNAAYFLAGNCRGPLKIYSEDLPTKEFVDFSRPLRGKSILNLDFVFDEVLVNRKPLDYLRALASETSLAVAVTAVDWLTPALVKDFADPADLRAALRASTWMPGAVRGTADFRGERAIDGNVLAAHPWAFAQVDGCSHILSLSTHPILEPRSYNAVALRYAMRYLDRLEPGLGEGYRGSLVVNQRHLGWLRRWRNDPDPAPYVLDVGPLPGAPPIKRHEMDRPTIVAAARDAYDLMVGTIEPATARVGGG